MMKGAVVICKNVKGQGAMYLGEHSNCHIKAHILHIVYKEYQFNP